MLTISRVVNRFGRPMRANLLWSDDEQWTKIKRLIAINRPARGCHVGEPDNNKQFGGGTHGGHPFQVTPAGRHHARDPGRQIARSASVTMAYKAAFVECCYCRLKDFRRMATRYDQRTPNLFPASAWSPPWSTGDGLIESGSRLTLAYPISTVSRKPRFHRVSIKPFLRRFYVYLRTEDPNLRRGAWRPSSTSRGDVLAYRGGDVGDLSPAPAAKCTGNW
jgi:hypothetical protein